MQPDIFIPYLFKGEKKMTNRKKILSVISLFVLLAVTALSVISCGQNNQTPTDTEPVSAEQNATVTITVQVTDNEGKTTDYEIATQETTLRGALEQEKLVEGEESEYGLYIKTVAGVTADYDTDGSYWALYQGDEYLMTSADTTPIADGDLFKIVYTK